MPETIATTSHGLAKVTVLDQSQESHIDQLHRAALGPVNADYYLPILARFETYDRASPSWNWAASLCTLNWLVFRGLWRPALAYLSALAAAALGLMALTHFTTGMAESIRWGLWAALATLALLVPGFFANTWLFNNHRQRLAMALTATPTLRDACLQLSRQASSRQRLMGLALANGLLAMMLAVAWWLPTNSASPDTSRADHPRSVVGATAPLPSASSAPAAAPAIASAPVMPASDVPAASAPESSVAAHQSGDAGAPSDIAKPTTPFRLSQEAARHAAITARSRKAHQTPVAATPAPAASAGAATEPAALVKDKPARTATPDASDATYLINVGLFAQSDNAQRTFTRLTQAGLPATTQQLQRSAGTLTRVRVGPFASRAQADAAALQIRALQLDAVVIRQ
ncbi:MAG: SPOR domain-containing protein [Burkholderiaceae bacterium]